MANGSPDARVRHHLVSRKPTGRRLLILGWIAAIGLPGAPQCSAQVADAAANGPTDSAVSQAIALEAPQRPEAVAQTAGGVLGQLFGPPPSTGGKDEGRRAYPLPPPDPASVNWNGVPYHPPTPGALAASGAATDQPIRDVTADRGAGTSTANGGASASGNTGTAAGGRSALNSVIPQPPPSGQGAPAVVAARVASAPLPPATSSTEATLPELSTNSSSRRSGRRAIDPLSPEGLLPATVKAEATPPSAAQDFPSVARRPMEPAGTPTPANPTNAANVKPPLPPATSDAKTATALPPSLAAIDAKMAAQQTDTQTSDKPTSPQATAAKQPTRADTAIPSPVSRTQPMIPAVNTPTYPAETIASELSPLRPMQNDVAKPNQTKPQDYIGSGVAANSLSAAATAPADKTKPALPNAGQTPLIADAEMSADDQDPSIPSAAAEFVARGQAAETSQSRTANGKSKQLAASEMPGIRIVTEGPSEILIRQLTQYEVRVENRGSTDATGVVVRTALPSWAEVKGHNASGGVIKPIPNDAKDAADQLEWTLDHLPAGVVERLFVRIQPTGAGSFDVATHWTTLPQTHTAQVTVREPKLTVQIEGPDEIIYGQSQKYRVRVLNPGDAAASNVLFTLVPDSGEPVKQTIGSIPAGKESSFEIELTARDLGQLKIDGTATADLDLKAAAKKSVAVAAAKIEATLSGPSLKFQNTDAVYQVEVTNRGQAASESVSGQVRLPEGMQYVGGIEGAHMEGDRLSWMIGTLPPGETKEYDFTCKMERTGNHSIAFECEGSAAGRASVGIETAVQAIADLKLSVIDPPAPAPVGAEVFYEVVIHNRGSKAAEDVRVVAQFGNGIEPVRVDGHAGDVVTGQVLFNPIPRIDAGKQIKLKIAAKADRPGDLRFRVEVRSGESVLVAEEATVFVEIASERISRSSSESASR